MEPATFQNLVVLVTEPRATLQAVDVAERLARSLDADVTVLSVQVPLPQPRRGEVLVPDSGEISRLHARIRSAARMRFRVVVARRVIAAVASLLPPESLVVVGGRRGRFWPTPTSRLSRALERLGHYVVFVDEAAHAA